MHPDIGDLDEKNLKRMLLIRSEDDKAMVSARLSAMIFFLSTAKSILDESQPASFDEFIKWVETNPYKFFTEVDAVKEIFDEYKNRRNFKSDG